MKKLTGVLAVSALALVFAGWAHAETGKTRAQVESELVAAQKAGDVSLGDAGMTQRDMFPHAYVQPQTRSDAERIVIVAPVLRYGVIDAGKTRAEVKAELALAAAAGELSFGDGGLTQRDQFPGVYPLAAPAPVVHSSL